MCLILEKPGWELLGGAAHGSRRPSTAFDGSRAFLVLAYVWARPAVAEGQLAPLD